MNWLGPKMDIDINPEMDILIEGKDQTKKVLKMRAMPSDTFRSLINQALLDYWRTLCRGRRRPAWSDVHLMDLYKIAARLVIKDVDGDGDEFINRYWGTALTDTLGYDASGKALGDTYPPHVATALGDMYRLALKSPSPVRIIGLTSMAKKKEHLHLEAIVLPLDAAPNVIGHLICAYDYTYKPHSDELVADCPSSYKLEHIAA